uniref:C-type lectin domain-containing protein n=1 Tax=Poecilia reticulata TaxID=8081 RepID=A0A3P9N2V5_POERE
SIHPSIHPFSLHPLSLSGVGRGAGLDPQYVYVNKEMNWSSAQMYCRENFVDLATVSSDEQNWMIEKLMYFGSYSWIGLFRYSNFFWSDGSSVSFTNWDNVYNPIDSMTLILVKKIYLKMICLHHPFDPSHIRKHIGKIYFIQIQCKLKQQHGKLKQI